MEKRRTKLIRPLRGGRITIPAEYRKRLGITEDSVLEVSVEGAELRVKPLEARPTVSGSP